VATVSGIMYTVILYYLSQASNFQNMNMIRNLYIIYILYTSAYVQFNKFSIKKKSFMSRIFVSSTYVYSILDCGE